MKTAKEEAQYLLDILPDDASMDMILAELHFKARVMRSEEQIASGDLYTQEQVIERLSKWLDPSRLATPSKT